MVQVLMIIMAFGALLGGLDRILGNRFGFGKAFEEGFQMLGPVALSMAGIICLAPVLSSVLGRVITPLYHALHQDPSMFASILAIDMGGYQMALELADDALIGRFAGIIAASILGCTISFTIPAGMGLLEGETRQYFGRGILYGLVSMPFALLIGALLCRLPLIPSLVLCLPVIILTGLIMVCLIRFPEKTLKGFAVFAQGLKILTTLGLAVGAFQYLSGWVILPHLAPLEDAMVIISSICITLLGSLPLAEVLRRVLKKPMEKMDAFFRIGEGGVMGMLLSYMNATPGLVAMKTMPPRAVVICAAFTVCAASAATAHFAFTMSVQPDLALPLLVTKLLGAVIGAVIAHCMTRDLAQDT